MTRLLPKHLREAANRFLWNGRASSPGRTHSCHAVEAALPLASLDSDRTDAMREYVRLLVDAGALSSDNLRLKPHETDSIDFWDESTASRQGTTYCQAIRFMLLHFLALYLEDEAERVRP